MTTITSAPMTNFAAKMTHTSEQTDLGHPIIATTPMVSNVRKILSHNENDERRPFTVWVQNCSTSACSDGVKFSHLKEALFFLRSKPEKNHDGQ